MISPRDTTAHFQRLLKLLDVESKAEASRALERNRRLGDAAAELTGETLLNLRVIDEDAGLGGRTLLTLAKRSGEVLPWNRLDVGTPVLLSTGSHARVVTHRGVVSERFESTLRVAFAKLPDDLDHDDRWRLDVAPDEVSVERQRASLRFAEGARGNRLADLREVLVGNEEAAFAPRKDFVALNQGLNPPQLEAVALALSAHDVALIHGPPGTGKTTTLVEFMCQAVRRGSKILCCAPSNVAVDNLLQRLVAAGQRVIRLGHPARVSPVLRAHTLDLLVDAHQDVRLARKLVKQARTMFRKAERYTRAKPLPGERQDTRREAKVLLADARKLEDRAVEHLLDTADIVCATTTGLDRSLLGERHFDTAVIDEACQTTEPGCWTVACRADRLVLAGDHCQLPPTVVSAIAKKEGFDVSLFERLVGIDPAKLSRRLTVQYRMHETIMTFPSLEFYDGELEAHGSVAEHRLCDLSDIAPSPLTETPLLWIDTAGAGFDEGLDSAGESRANSREADCITAKLHELLQVGIAPAQIAVIAPYAAQVRLLRDRWRGSGIEIDTVDGFQGREKEVVLITLVRSNPRCEIGFLAETRRMNVAITRARRKLIVVGDSATLGADPFFARLVEYCQGVGAYQSVWEDLSMW